MLCKGFFIHGESYVEDYSDLLGKKTHWAAGMRIIATRARWMIAILQL